MANDSHRSATHNYIDFMYIEKSNIVFWGLEYENLVPVASREEKALATPDSRPADLLGSNLLISNGGATPEPPSDFQIQSQSRVARFLPNFTEMTRFATRDSRLP